MKLDSNEIQNILPHRYPFLLVDKIIDGTIGEKATGIKCITANELQFTGHFPENHIMPGVLIIEALAQVGAVILLMEEENKNKLVFFGGIKQARFKKPVKPGDVLELKVELIKRKGPIGIGNAVALVEGEVVCSATLTFAVQ